MNNQLVDQYDDKTVFDLLAIAVCGSMQSGMSEQEILNLALEMISNEKGTRNHEQLH